MSSSVGNNIPLTAAPEEQFGRTMRIPGHDARRVVPARRRGAVPARRADGREARARAASSSPARTAPEAAAAAEAHFTRVVREGGAPEEVPEGALPGRRPDPPAGAARGGVRALDERRARMIGQGGVKVNGAAVTALDLPALGARRSARAGREAPFRALPALARLTQQRPDPATIDKPPVREAAENALSLDTGAAFERIGYDLVPNHPWASGASRRSFCCPTRPASIFENSTAYVKRRGPSSSLRRGRGVTPSVRSAGETVFPSMPCGSVMRCLRAGSRRRADRHLSSSSREDNSLSASSASSEARRRRQVLHGEFDPGSGRTLAARLTHASRARTRTSVLGTAANG